MKFPGPVLSVMVHVTKMALENAFVNESAFSAGLEGYRIVISERKLAHDSNFVTMVVLVEWEHACLEETADLHA